MHINKVKIYNFRNILTCDITPHPELNIIIGDNGSGKTSFIESLYFLSLGRSFRTTKINHILNHEEKNFQIFSEIETDKQTTTIALQKSRNGDSTLKMNYEIQKKQSVLTYNLPIQLFNPEGFMLLNAGAQARCKIIDWGTFYTNNTFQKTWSETKRLLRQRNAALKQGYNKSTIQIWDNDLIIKAELLDQLRQSYINKLLPILNNIIRSFLSKHTIDIQYYRGWSHEHDFTFSLKKNFEYDLRIGQTNSGPHRADLRVKANGIIAQDVLSRGQQKLFVCALKLAQGMLFSQENHTPCIYLIDDLPSELDSQHMDLFLSQLFKQKSQVFLTSINPINNKLPDEYKVNKIVNGVLVDL
jgi:DNA replication and repair protein RecF